MKKIKILLLIFFITFNSIAQEPVYNGENFEIETVQVSHKEELSLTVWTIKVKGNAGETTPVKAGQLDGAPVLGYVFPTNLDPTDVGFNKTEGIVALALTSHPDFDDTPLWDENSDKNYLNDGIIWHPHWVVLVTNNNVGGGLAVKQFKKGDTSVTLPPTNPGMPMYMDSPGFQVTTKANSITVVIPDYRINNKKDFNFDGVTAFLKVNTSNPDLPMLGVYNVYSVASGDLSLPYKVER
ncbi:hypothetical protein [Xanthomarina spongicola]|uniref:Uncharacterized protein n=1 Tax=Xanthomarina spongicola TaxID=570520 RepID=A0A316DIG8_9FLAO|nr:hypothetical protein [Xanthomarina spongicola]PWK17408.1 hypothetical protein LX78_02741 [Xanthomarina spongicola]